MKKTYQKPTVEAMKIETVSLMAGSLSKDETVEITSEEDLLSRERRHSSVWGDDDDE